MAEPAGAVYNALSDTEQRWLRARVATLKAALAEASEPWRRWANEALFADPMGRLLGALPAASSSDADWDDARGKGRRASLGQVFTPPELAQLMARLADVTELDGPRDVLDPACGAGSLLVAVIELRLDAGWSLHDAFAHVEGWDRDPLAVWACRARLVLLALSRPTPFAPGPLRIFTVDALSKTGRPKQLLNRTGHFSGGLRALVGNPPYLEAKRMNGASPTMKQELRARFSQLSGAFDLYLAFTYLAIELVGDHGDVVLLVPNKITQSRYAAPFRRTVFERSDLHLRHLVDLSRTKPRPFPGTGVYPVVLHLGVGTDSACQMRRVDRLDQIERDDWQTISVEAMGRVGGEHPFFVSFAQTWPHLEPCLDAQRLGEVAEIRSTVSFHRRGLREQYVQESEPENHGHRYLGLRSRTRRIEVSAFRSHWAGGWIRYDEAELRECGNRLPKIELFTRAKVVFCQHARRMMAVADPEGRWVCKDVYPIAWPTDPRWTLFKLVALLNSTVFTSLYNTVYQGIVVGGETYHYLPAFLKHVPIPAGDHPAMARAAVLAERLHGAVGDVDLQDWRALDLCITEAYGLTPAQRDLLVQTHLARVGAQSPG